MKKILAFRNDWVGLGPKGSDLMGGVGYYRIHKPMQALQDTYSVFELGDPIAAQKKLATAGIDWPIDDVIPNLIKDCDLVLMKNVSHPGGLAWFAGAAKYYNKPLLVDMDDNYMAVDDLNPRRKYFNDDALTQIVHKELFKAATAMIVATEPLKSVYEEFNKNVHVINNFNDVNDWKFPKTHRADGRITVGWAGSLTHESDFHVFEPVMHRLWKRYGEKIIFSMCGSWPEKLMADFPKESYVVYSGTRTMRDYHQRLALWGFDIGVAPLKESTFNEGKGHGKWMEYAMYRIPTVASNFGPYRAVIEDGRTGFLAKNEDEWVADISELIERPSLRKEVGTAAYQEVKEKWQWKDNAWRWKEVFEQYLGKGYAQQT